MLHSTFLLWSAAMKTALSDRSVPLKIKIVQANSTAKQQSNPFFSWPIYKNVQTIPKYSYFCTIQSFLVILDHTDNFHGALWWLNQPFLLMIPFGERNECSKVVFSLMVLRIIMHF